MKVEPSRLPAILYLACHDFHDIMVLELQLEIDQLYPTAEIWKRISLQFSRWFDESLTERVYPGYFFKSSLQKGSGTL